MTQYSIRYLTEYRYDEPVTDNLNSLRVKPATTPLQQLDDFGVRTDPEARLHQHTDYFGTNVIEFNVTRAHEALSVEVRADVTVNEPPDPPDPPWETLEGAAYRAAGIEYLLPWPGEPDDIRLDELIGETRAETPLATLRKIVELIPDRFEYKAGVTYVGSTVEDLLDGGAGVCQDFAHLALLALRRNGIASRYVSGYLFAPPEGDESADSAEVDSHAWVESLLAPGTWVGIDPTNRRFTGDNHVKIGHGRNYADVPPIKGVYRGGATSELDVTVRMHRQVP